MEKISETAYQKYIYPRHFFGLPADAEIEATYFHFTNEDRSIVVTDPCLGRGLPRLGRPWNNPHPHTTEGTGREIPGHGPFGRFSGVLLIMTPRPIRESFRNERPVPSGAAAQSYNRNRPEFSRFEHAAQFTPPPRAPPGPQYRPDPVRRRSDPPDFRSLPFDFSSGPTRTFRRPGTERRIVFPRKPAPSSSGAIPISIRHGSVLKNNKCVLHQFFILKFG